MAVEYATGERDAGEAAQSLARFLGTTETRAAGLLGDPTALGTEIRARRSDPLAARRLLERKYAPRWR